jgi:hypothetical protein
MLLPYSQEGWWRAVWLPLCKANTSRVSLVCAFLSMFALEALLLELCSSLCFYSNRHGSLIPGEGVLQVLSRAASRTVI